MDILITCSNFNRKNLANQWSETMYRTLALMGHSVYLKTYVQDDIPRGFNMDDGRNYDLALINDHDPKYISADCKIYVSHSNENAPIGTHIPTGTVDCPGIHIPFPLDIGWLMANSPLGFAAQTNKELKKELECHDVVTIALQYLKLAEQFLSLCRN